MDSYRSMTADGVFMCRYLQTVNGTHRMYGERSWLPACSHWKGDSNYICDSNPEYPCAIF